MANINLVGVDLSNGKYRPIGPSDSASDSQGNIIVGATGLIGATGVAGIGGSEGVTGLRGIQGVTGLANVAGSAWRSATGISCSWSSNTTLTSYVQDIGEGTIRLRVKVATSNTPTAASLTFGLPWDYSFDTAVLMSAAAGDSALNGTAVINDAGTAMYQGCLVYTSGTEVISVLVPNSSGTYTTLTPVNSTTPISFGASDTIIIDVLIPVLGGGITETFNSSGSWIAPGGITSVTVECWGAGGGSIQQGGFANGGGGGGAYSRKILAVIPGNSYDYIIGAGGTNASHGGDTYFIDATTVMAKGGNSNLTNTNSGQLGGQAASCVGDVAFSGGTGGNGANGSHIGAGGAAAGRSNNGANGVNFTPGVGVNGGASGASPVGNGTQPGGGASGGGVSTPTVGGAGRIVVRY